MSYIKIRPLSKNLSIWSPIVLICLWGHSGRLTPASGTWGSLAALPAIIAIQSQAGASGLLVFALLCFAAGLWALPYYTAAVEKKDPSEVVIDEVVGVSLTYLAAPHVDGATLLVGFIAFRFFDVLKPGPIGWCDRHLKGAWGVLMDDVIAGLLACLCVYGYQRLV